MRVREGEGVRCVVVRWILHKAEQQLVLTMFCSTDLKVGGQFHGSDRVDVFFDLCEKVVPSSDDLTLVLVVYQLKLVGLPRLSHLAEERERGRDGMQTERKKRQR